MRKFTGYYDSHGKQILDGDVLTDTTITRPGIASAFPSIKPLSVGASAPSTNVAPLIGNWHASLVLLRPLIQERMMSLMATKKQATAGTIEIPPLSINNFVLNIVGESPLIVHAWSDKAKLIAAIDRL